MGAFLLVKNTKFDYNNFETKLSKVLDLFTTKIKLPFSGKFILGEFTLYLFKKKFYEGANHIKLENGDFIASTGSLYYKGYSGKIALINLYKDFLKNDKIENHCRGHYFVIIKENNSLFVFRDFYGIYPVYQDFSQEVISSSFLAVAFLQENLSISKNELYEYLFNGFWSEEKTLFEEILLLKYGQYINLKQKETFFFSPEYMTITDKNYSQILNIITETLNIHFSELTSAFNKISLGLSGGYDSRLILAALLRQNVIPDLYVNGTPNSIDIQCAKKIVEGTKLNLREVHYYEYYKNIEDNILNFIYNRFYYFDGLGVGGLFDLYSDIEYKQANPNKNTALLNGAGGEIYREAWNILIGKFSLKAYVQARYNKYNFSNILHDYSGNEYLKNIENKIHNYINEKHKRIDRQALEKLHPSRYKAIHFIMGTMQLFNPFVMPFYEFHLIEQSVNIPVKYKYYGKLNKDLIMQQYPSLSSYMSAYGYNFENNIPLKIALKENLVSYTPLSLRPILRNFKKSKKLPVERYGHNLLSNSIIECVLPYGTNKINDYIIVKNIAHDTIKSRAFSLELLFNELKL